MVSKRLPALGFCPELRVSRGECRATELTQFLEHIPDAIQSVADEVVPVPLSFANDSSWMRDIESSLDMCRVLGARVFHEVHGGSPPVIEAAGSL